MQRRDFLKGACRICLLGAAGATAIDIASCTPGVGNALSKPTVNDNTIQVPLSMFDNTPIQVISPKNYAFEIAVEKKQDGTYEALLLRCTHYPNQLMPTGNGYTCNVHGSRFNKEGKVVKGPAATSLKKLTTSITGQNLLVNLIKI